MPIEPETRIGAVALRVGDLSAMQGFYENAIGMETIDTSPDAVSLAAPGTDRALIRLIPDPNAPARPRRSTGLFHLAILLPSREELGIALHRLAVNKWRLAGASDHLVSEAIYVNDPEGNGIEIYRDRPHEEWKTNEQGELEMGTLPLDIQDVFADGEDDPDRPLARETVIGHVHLNVSELSAIERFYVGALGFGVTVRSYPGALFVAAGDYHHHIGLNTWLGPGAPPPPEGSLGLDHYEVIVPSSELVEAAADRLKQSGFTADAESQAAVHAADPSGNRLHLRPA